MSSRKKDGGCGAKPGRLDQQARAELEELAAFFAEARVGSGSARESLATVMLPRIREDGVIEGWPWTHYGPPMARFWSAVHRLQLCAHPFHWPAWLNNICATGANPLDPALVASFSVHDLGRYVIALERAERFTDGIWRAALHSGVLEAIVRRILALDRQRQL